jgi:hypothetical protein
MTTLHPDIPSITNVLRRSVSPERFALLQSMNTATLPTIAYTSYDGDNYSHHELIKQYCLRKQVVPLHPGSALGMYIATMHHKGRKQPIVEDCISLIDMADEFYVMVDDVPSSEQSIRALPEGIIAELLYWTSKRALPVTYVDVSTYALTKQRQHDMTLMHDLHEKQQQGIADILASCSDLRPVTYMLSGEKYGKYTDWMMKDAMERKRVPLPPYAIISHGTLELATPGDEQAHLLSRLALGVRASDISLYGTVPPADFSLESLPIDALEELFCILSRKPDTAVSYTYFGAIGVPKYVDRDKWAITSLEKGR